MCNRKDSTTVNNLFKKEKKKDGACLEVNGWSYVKYIGMALKPIRPTGGLKLMCHNESTFKERQIGPSGLFINDPIRKIVNLNVI